LKGVEKGRKKSPPKAHERNLCNTQEGSKKKKTWTTGKKLVKRKTAENELRRRRDRSCMHKKKKKKRDGAEVPETGGGDGQKMQIGDLNKILKKGEKKKEPELGMGKIWGGGGRQGKNLLSSKCFSGRHPDGTRRREPWGG